MPGSHEPGMYCFYDLVGYCKLKDKGRLALWDGNDSKIFHVRVCLVIVVFSA